jgi:2-haloalkanoic acid dehalogenase type II
MYTLPKAITFDCYGTLIDWEGEIARFFADMIAARHIAGVDPRALQRHWEEVQFASIEQYRPYRQVLRETMSVACADVGLPYTEEDVEAFVASMGQWRPFPDTQASLQALQELGIKVVLITNTDDDIIKETQPLLGIKPDDIITAQQAGAYKPSHLGFHLARRRLGLAVQDIWHAGFGFKYDIIPATELGYTTVWINRQGEARPSDVRETFLVGDMTTLVYLLKGIAASSANQPDPRQRFIQMYLEGRIPWDSGISPPELLEAIEGPLAQSPGRALDVGCGTGTNSVTMALHGWQVVGVDFAAPAIARAEIRAAEAREQVVLAGGSLAFMEADVTQLAPPAAPSERMNLVLDLGCLNGIPQELRPAYARAMGEQAAPGALFLLYAHIPRPDGSGPVGCMPEELDALFSADFELEKRVMGLAPQGGESMWNWLRRRD